MIRFLKSSSEKVGDRDGHLICPFLPIGFAQNIHVFTISCVI